MMYAHKVLGMAVLAAALALGAATAHGSVITPYVNDFSTSVGDFTATTGAQWTLTGTGTYKNRTTSADLAMSSVVDVSDLGGPAATADDFTLTTSFIIRSYVGANTTFGFAALGNSTALSSFYLADVQGNGTMRLYRINSGGNTALTSTTFAGGTLQTGVEYTLTLDGTYNDLGDLTLDLLLSSPTLSTSINSTLLAANVYQGRYFGLRDRSSGAGSRLDVDFLGLSIVPEPATLALLGLGAAATVALRRRRRTY